MFSELLAHCKKTMMILTVEVMIVLLEMFSKPQNCGIPLIVITMEISF